jgi:S1-C subfamily serine protease
MALFKNFTNIAVLGIAWLFAAEAVGASNSAVVGTGFFVSESGKVITNNHVVRDCRSLRLKGLTEELPMPH